MTALNFQARFATAVADGTKRQTIRAERKDGRMPCKVGDTLQLYTGQRTKACRLLRTVTCRSVERIEIDCRPGVGTTIHVAGIVFGNRASWTLAHSEGFDGVDALVDWFWRTHGLPFSGWLIKWDEVTS